MNPLTETTGSNEEWLQNSPHSNQECRKKGMNGAESG
jgi:hypothetical protein